MNNKKYYKPLPDNLTIAESPIEGLGLFATKLIEANTNLGITHIKDDRFVDGYIRTALGSFFNHSENPNCKVVHENDFIYLWTLKDIQINEEILVTYTLYNPTK